jgi:hypothetical protein
MKKDLENGVPRSKVIHLITTINIGGAENQLALLSQLQSENGSEVTIIPLKDCGDAQKVKFSSNVKIYRGVTNRNVILQVDSIFTRSRPGCNTRSSTTSRGIFSNHCKDIKKVPVDLYEA